MQLKKNQYVVFEDGHKENHLQARWSERNQDFISYKETEDGETIKMFSTTIIDKPERSESSLLLLLITALLRFIR